MKATGVLDTLENCWDFFIDKVGSWQEILHSLALLNCNCIVCSGGGESFSDDRTSCDETPGRILLFLSQFVLCLKRGLSCSSCIHVMQVRCNLHVVLCFSPVGEKFQVRARQFPALVSCLTYDHFHTWPQEVWPSTTGRNR